MPPNTSEKKPAGTPMLSQYTSIKKQYPDAILFYRMGDFYEMFFEDAATAAPVLEVQLTSRDKSAENPIPMCGVPYHAAMGYIQKLLSKGFKVALCEQMEDPATAKGIVRRDVVRVMTPALIGDPELVADDTRHFLVSLEETSRGTVDVCALDLLGGEWRVGELSLPDVTELLGQLEPRELLTAGDSNDKPWWTEWQRLFPQMLITRRPQYFIDRLPDTSSTAHSALVHYLRETQKLEALPHLGKPQSLADTGRMTLDLTTLNALEVASHLSPHPDQMTLFRVLDQTSTPMGRRTLREWLVHPLCDRLAIEARHQAVAELSGAGTLGESLRQVLADIRDLERLTTKTALGLAMPRDLVTMRAVLKAVPALKTLLKSAKAPLLKELGKKLDALGELTEHLEKALEDAPPANLREGGIFRDGFHPEIAELRALSNDAKSTIAGIEQREKNRTGISTLKIRYNRVFGYTIEITKSQLSRVPKEYHRKQTIANGERYVTEELKAFEEKVLSADHRLRRLEESLFLELRRKVADHSLPLLTNSKKIGALDVLLSFARVARTRGYTRPQMHDGWELSIVDGRHPVIETLLPVGRFVPNPVDFHPDSCRTLIITGPNMAGKSTIMRQVALLSIMAQAGSFVPAQAAKLPLVDAIFTRIGSSDDLTRGRSTFMVEMTEVARIMERATERSLILIDEIGRGTSTYDGLSLAWSLLEHIHTKVRAKTLFATHFHELTALESSLAGLKNANVLVEKWNNEIVFLHRLAPGICNQSYGIEVAKLAGLPSEVLSRARAILGVLETQSQRATRVRNRALETHDNQLGFFEEPTSPENRTGLNN